MTELIVRPNYHFEGDGWDALTKYTAKELYMDLRNEWVPLANEIIDGANQEWDQLHPEITGMEDDSPEWKAYIRFISEKYQPACDEITDKYLMMPYIRQLFKCGTDPESSDFTLELRNGKGYLWVDYTPVNE